MTQELQQSSNEQEMTEKTVRKKKLYKRWWFWAIIVLVIFIAFDSGNNGGVDLIDLPESEYKTQCEVYSYDEIARYPDEYERKLAKFNGEVIQVIRNGDDLQMRVNVTQDKYGYDDTVFVFYTITNGVNVLEGDIITMYGELRGLQEYESVLGAQISIPRIYVKYIDIKQ